jgi:hypothetical protein
VDRLIDVKPGIADVPGFLLNDPKGNNSHGWHHDDAVSSCQLTG